MLKCNLTSYYHHKSFLSFLEQRYPVRDIERRTGLGKSIVGRIKKEVDTEKEKNLGGCPFKLSTCDKTSTIQIQSGKLDNAVQATQFINSTLPHPVHPQTVRRALQESGSQSATKKKVLMLKKTHQKQLEFAKWHENWTLDDWKRVLWLDETKINRIELDGKVYVWKKRGESISECTKLPTVKHGGEINLMVWECMDWNGVGMLIEVKGKMNAEQHCQILGDGGWKALKNWRWWRVNGTFSRTMTPNTHLRRLQNGLKTMISKFYHGQHSLQTLTPLNTSGNISNDNFVNTATHWRSTWIVG